MEVAGGRVGKGKGEGVEVRSWAEGSQNRIVTSQIHSENLAGKGAARGTMVCSCVLLRRQRQSIRCCKCDDSPRLSVYVCMYFFFYLIFIMNLATCSTAKPQTEAGTSQENSMYFSRHVSLQSSGSAVSTHLA